jgi:hypothetical protein
MTDRIPNAFIALPRTYREIGYETRTWSVPSDRCCAGIVPFNCLSNASTIADSIVCRSVRASVGERLLEPMFEIGVLVGDVGYHNRLAAFDSAIVWIDRDPDHSIVQRIETALFATRGNDRELFLDKDVYECGSIVDSTPQRSKEESADILRPKRTPINLGRKTG